MVMLTDTSNLLSGGEQIKVNGVIVALQKETDQQKRLQFLQITANPLDAELVGELGRASVLRALASDLGLPDDIVPDDDAISTQVAAKKQAQMAMIQQNLQQQKADMAIKAGSAAAKAGVDPGQAIGALAQVAGGPPGTAQAIAEGAPVMPQQGGGAPTAGAPPGGPQQNNFRPPGGASSG